jgi:hypothetical protein
MLELMQVHYSLLLEVLDGKCSPCFKSFVDSTLVDNAASSFPQLISKHNIAAFQPQEPRLEATFTVSQAMLVEDELVSTQTGVAPSLLVSTRPEQKMRFFEFLPFKSHKFGKMFSS